MCANVVRDATGVAAVSAETGAEFDAALQRTLLAFEEASGVPWRVQLEILEALGKLGAMVKEHLVAATRSRNFQVRSRALEMLVAHLSDDELFSMTHVFRDRS